MKKWKLTKQGIITIGDIVSRPKAALPQILRAGMGNYYKIEYYDNLVALIHSLGFRFSNEPETYNETHFEIAEQKKI